MYCINCGQQISGDSVFCTFCGANQNASSQSDASIPSTNGSSNVFATQTPITTDWTNSYFDGGFWGLVGVNLVVAFLTVISLGFAWPALWCYRLRWIYRHTVVGGYRLKFNGTGGQLFGKYILWVLFTIITLSIYSLFIPIKYKKWEISHVEIESVIPNRK